MCGTQRCGCHAHGHHSHSCCHSQHQHSHCCCNRDHGHDHTVKCDCHDYHHTGHVCHCKCHTEAKGHYHHSSTSKRSEKHEKVDKRKQIEDIKAHLASLTEEFSSLKARLENLSAEAECENPEKLEGEPGDCSPEQIEECHGDEEDHSCTD